MSQQSQQPRSKRDNNPNGYPPPTPDEAEIHFTAACGLRRGELLNLRVSDIHLDAEGHVWIHVVRQAGRRERDVPVPTGYEQVILERMRDARLFSYVPRRFDVQKARREYACRLYYQLLRVSQYPPLIREYNEEAVHKVMEAIGHDDIGIVCRYYLGLQNAPADQVTTYSTKPDPADQESAGPNAFSWENARE